MIALSLSRWLDGRQPMIASVSGVRGIPNADLTLSQLARMASRFAELAKSDSFLVGRDTRRTGIAIARAVEGPLLATGAEILELGVVSTPALFRESRMTGKPAVMITASHNEPEFNGLKFIIGGLGADEEMMREVVEDSKAGRSSFKAGKIRSRATTRYNDDLVSRFGPDSLDGMRVALDLGGGAAIQHAVPVLRKLGCEVLSLNDTPGVFNRIVDPTKDELAALGRMTKERDCAIGLGFDCDGDRLVVVDDKGTRRTGDHMLALSVSRLLQEARKKDVVVSVDTSSAIDDVVGRVGGKVFRSKVGEANVVEMMERNDVDIGGEGSSGGLIDGSFNYCRDSMLAALLIIEALKEEGPRFFDSVPAYRQARGALALPRGKIPKVMSRLGKEHGEADRTDGIKIRLGRRSWVLVRPSNTEHVIRISAEAGSEDEATRILRSYTDELRELSA